MRKEKYQQAAEELQLFYQNNKNYKCAGALVACYWALRDFDKANRYAQEYVNRNPKDPSGYFMVFIKELGESFQDTSRFHSKSVDEIVDLSRIKEFAKRNPDDPRSEFLLREIRLAVLFYKVFRGISFENLSRPTMNQADLDEIKQLESYFSKAAADKSVGQFSLNKSLAAVKILSSEYEQAIEYCRRAINVTKNDASRINSNAAGIYGLLESIYMLKRDTLSAMKMVKEKINKTIDNYKTADDLCRLAQYKLWQKDFTDSEKSLKTALEINPLTQSAFIGLAGLEILKGNLESAKDLLMKASSSGEDKANIETLNGIIWMEIGDVLAAQQSFNRALQLDEEFDPPKRILKRYFIEQ